MKKILVILIMCVTFSVSAQTYLECTEHNGWEWVDGVIEFYEKNSAGKIERLNNQIDSLRTVINAEQKGEPKEQESEYHIIDDYMIFIPTEYVPTPTWDWQVGYTYSEAIKEQNRIDSIYKVAESFLQKIQERTYEKPLTSFNSQDFHRLFQMGVHLQRWEQKQKSIKYNIYKLN